MDRGSTSVQVMACCLTARSHHLTQCCPSSMTPYGVTGPQWVKHWCKQWLGAKQGDKPWLEKMFNSLPIVPLETQFGKIWIKTWWFSFKKIHFKLLSAKSQPLCSSLNVLSLLCLLTCTWLHKFDNHWWRQWLDTHLVPKIETDLSLINDTTPNKYAVKNSPKFRGYYLRNHCTWYLCGGLCVQSLLVVWK